MKKYGLTQITKETVLPNGRQVTLRKIRALITFQNPVSNEVITHGMMGGWIENESNLDQEGNCWLDRESEATGNSRICGNAYVKASQLYDDSVAKENASISNTELHQETCVSGNSKTFYSFLYGNTMLTENAVVADSELTNVQTYDVSSKTKSYYMDTCIIKSAQPVLINDDCHFYEVQLSGEKIEFSSETRLESVTAHQLKRLIVRSPLVMERVDIQNGSGFGTTIGTEKSILLGGREKKITIKSESLALFRSTITGSVTIEGKWVLSLSTISNYAILLNDSEKLQFVTKSTIQDLASLVCKSDYTGAVTTKSYQLRDEDSFIIQ